MLEETSPKSWYAANTGNHQGLIIEEETGRNIAVAYDKADAPLIAAAPVLLKVLKKLSERYTFQEADQADVDAAIREAEER